MAPYEQKTDSREFELANAELSSGSASSPDPTEIVIQLWGLEGYHQPDSLSWKTESICIYMIADLVAASHGRIAEDSAGFMTAQFDSSGEALVAAKRIQRAILEFLSGQPGEAVGAAILIHQPNGQSFGHDELGASLTQARPGQILIPEGLCRRWDRTSGMSFRPVESASQGEAQQVSLMELIWSAPEQIDRLRVAEPATLQRPTSGTGLAAPMIGALPVEGSKSTTADHKMSPEAATVDFVFQHQTGAYSPTNTSVREAGEPGVPESSENAGKLLLEDLDREDRPFFTRGKIFVGLAAVILIAAFLAVMYWPEPVPKSTHRAPATSVPEPATAAPAPAAGSGNTVPATASVPASKPPEPETTMRPKSPAVPVIETKAPVPQPKRSKAVPQNQPVKAQVEANSKPKPEAPAPAEPPVDVSGWSRKDIPQLLKMAATNVGAGRYEDARLAYRKILQLQPDSQEAKDGLHKLDLIEKDNSDQ